MNRIAKKILAVYVPELGNSRRQGEPFKAIRPKSPKAPDKMSPEWFKKFIQEYEDEIAEIKLKLKDNPSNVELLKQLKDKEMRKAQFEEDLNSTDSLIDWDEINEYDRIWEEKYNLPRYKKFSEDELEELEEAQDDLLLFLEQEFNNSKDDIIKHTISQTFYNIQSIQEFKDAILNKIKNYLKKRVNTFINKCRNDYKYNFLLFEDTFNNFMKTISNDNIITECVKHFKIINNSDSLFKALRETNQIPYIIHDVISGIKYALNRSYNTKQFLSDDAKINEIIAQKITRSWNTDLLYIKQYNRNIRNDIKYIVLGIQNINLDTIIQYISNSSAISEAISQLKAKYITSGIKSRLIQHYAY